MRIGNERVTIAVVTFNSESVIDGLISSLGAGFGDIPFDLVVADNASTDDSLAIVRHLAPEATVVEVGRNAGYAAGINAAVAAAPAHTAVLALNPDVRLGEGCIPELLRALREPGTGIAVPRLIDAHGQLIESIRRRPTVTRALADALLGARRAGQYQLLGEVASDPRVYDVEGPIDWAEGSTQLISAECWNACGPWDESYFLYSEETDFDLRSGDAGFATRFVPSAHATHLEGGSGASPELWSLLMMNRVRLFRRHHGTLPAIPFWAATLLRESSRALQGKATSRAAVRALVNPSRMRETPGPHSIRASR